MNKLLVIILMLMISSTSYAQPKKVHITNGEWPPYMSENFDQNGVVSQIVTEAFREEGVTVDWSFLPWKRAYNTAQEENKWNASCCWWPTQEIRDDGFILSDDIIENTTVFFHLKDYKMEWDSLDEIADKKIGSTMGYSYGEELDALIDNGTIKPKSIPNDYSAFKMLLKKRIDIYPTDLHVGLYHIANNFSDDDAQKFTFNETPLETTSLNLIVPQQSEDAEWLLKTFNSGLQKLKISGRYDEILSEELTDDYRIFKSDSTTQSNSTSN